MVAPIWREYGHTLTGNTRVRLGWRGRLVLQVEETYQTYQWNPRPSVDRAHVRWRDAVVTDVNGTAPLSFKGTV